MQTLNCKSTLTWHVVALYDYFAKTQNACCTKQFLQSIYHTEIMFLQLFKVAGKSFGGG